MPRPTSDFDRSPLWQVRGYGRERHPAGKTYWWDSAVRPRDSGVVLQLTTGGSIIYRDDRGDHRIKPGTLMVFIHGQPILYGMPEPLLAPYACRWVGLHGAGLVEHVRAFLDRHGPLHDLGLKHPLVDQLDALLVAAGPDHVASPTEVATRIHRLVIGLYDFAEREFNEQLSPVEQAIESILTRPQQPASLKEIATRHGVSREHLSRCFRQRTDRSAQDVLAEGRVRYGLALLTHTRLPLPEVVRQAGYANHHALVRHVRRATGLTPTAYREQHRSPG